MPLTQKVRFHILPQKFFEKLYLGTQRVIITVDDHTKQEIIQAANNDALSEFDIICVETETTYESGASLEAALERLTDRFMVLIPVDAIHGIPGLHADGTVLTVAMAERSSVGAKAIVAHAKKAAEPVKVEEKKEEPQHVKKARLKGKKKTKRKEGVPV